MLERVFWQHVAVLSNLPTLMNRRHEHGTRKRGGISPASASPVACMWSPVATGAADAEGPCPGTLLLNLFFLLLGDAPCTRLLRPLPTGEGANASACCNVLGAACCGSGGDMGAAALAGTSAAVAGGGASRTTDGTISMGPIVATGGRSAEASVYTAGSMGVGWGLSRCSILSLMWPVSLWDTLQSHTLLHEESSLAQQCCFYGNIKKGKKTN